VTAAIEQLRDTPSETLAICKGAALILRGTENFEFVDLLFFWSERISSVFLYSKCLQAKETISYQALNQVWTMTALMKNRKYEFYVTADAEVGFNELYVLRLR